MTLILTLHIATTFFMAGLCWFCQLVHYPLFFQIPLKDFPAYEAKNFATILITGPVMGLELLTGVYLLWYDPNNWFILNAVGIAVTALSTFVFQVPIHLQLRQVATHALLHKLIRTNWIRTLSWTIRMGVLGGYLYKTLT
jgi:hypothetical protein